jgi:nucleotide-binding universal stress UspA family protein
MTPQSRRGGPEGLRQLPDDAHAPEGVGGGDAGARQSHRPRRPGRGRPTTKEPRRSSTILVGVDASTRSHDAVALARRLASGSDARLMVVCSFADAGEPATVDPAVREGLARSARQTAQRMSAELGLRQERLAQCVVTGRSPASALCDIAISKGAGLIVVGPSPKRALRRVVPGSTPERLLHSAPCPVAVAPPRYGSEPDQDILRIGVAIGHSGDSSPAIAAGVELARALGASLELIGVVPADTYAALGLVDDPGDTADLKNRTTRGVDAAVAEVPSDIEAVPVVLAGEPAATLGKQTAPLDALVMATRRYDEVRAALAPGVSAGVLRAARCPVIAIPDGAHAALGAVFGVAAAGAG